MTRILLTAAVSAGLVLAANDKIDEANAKAKAGKFDEAIALLEAEKKAKPKDAAVTKALADASFAHGTSLMNDEALPPMRKYPAALRAFRKTMALDPSNKKAAENANMIESIYKSMGRPVPR